MLHFYKLSIQGWGGDLPQWLHRLDTKVHQRPPQERRLEPSHSHTSRSSTSSSSSSSSSSRSRSRSSSVVLVEVAIIEVFRINHNRTAMIIATKVTFVIILVRVASTDRCHDRRNGRG